jgi:hypothetical protein
LFPGSKINFDITASYGYTIKERNVTDFKSRSSDCSLKDFLKELNLDLWKDANLAPVKTGHLGQSSMSSTGLGGTTKLHTTPYQFLLCSTLKETELKYFRQLQGSKSS